MKLLSTFDIVTERNVHMAQFDTYHDYQRFHELKFNEYENKQSMKWAEKCLADHKLEEDYPYEKRGVPDYDNKYVSRKYKESIERRMDRLHEEFLEDYLDYRQISDPSFQFSDISSAQESLWPEFRVTIDRELTPAELRNAWEAFLERMS